MKHGTSRTAAIAAAALSFAALGALALPRPAGAEAFRITDSGVDNQLLVGFDTLVWRHDGDLVKFVDTPAHGYLTLGSGFGNLVSSAQVGANLFFSTQHTLWKSGGTEDSATEVATLEPAAYENTVADLTDLNGTLFFRGFTAEERFEPWASNGETTGTRLVKAVNPGFYSGMGGWRAVLGNYALFNGEDPLNGVELWASNGQEGGTYLVKDINPAPGGSSLPDSLYTCGSHVYFTADDGVNGRSLWVTDGSNAGTNRLTSGLEPTGYNFTCVGRLLFFDGYSTANTRRELWVYDPLDPPAVLVKGDWDTCAGCGPQLHTFRSANNLLLFAAKDALHGTELWRSDGSPGGTVMVKDIWPGLDYTSPTPWPYSSDPYDMTVSGGKLYFRAYHPDFGSEVWVSDGTADGTWPVTDLRPGPANAWPDQLTAAGQNVFFRVTGDGSYNVWGFNPADTPPYRDFVRNGSFESTVYWSLLQMSPALDRRVCNQRSLEKCSFKVTGTATAAKSLRQTVVSNGVDLGAAGQRIQLSGWSKAVGAAAAGGFYGLEIVVTHVDGSTQVKRVPFTRASHPWEYKRVSLTAAEHWDRVAVYVRYLNQAGTAWFDDIRLTIR